MIGPLPQWAHFGNPLACTPKFMRGQSMVGAGGMKNNGRENPLGARLSHYLEEEVRTVASNELMINQIFRESIKSAQVG